MVLQSYVEVKSIPSVDKSDSNKSSAAWGTRGKAGITQHGRSQEPARFTTPMVTAGQELDVFLPSPQKGNCHQLPRRRSNFMLSAGLVTQGRRKIVAVLPDSQAALTSLLQPAGWIYGRGKSSFKIKVSESRPRLGSQ